MKNKTLLLLLLIIGITSCMTSKRQKAKDENNAKSRVINYTNALRDSGVSFVLVEPWLGDQKTYYVMIPIPNDNVKVIRILEGEKDKAIFLLNRQLSNYVRNEISSVYADSIIDIIGWDRFEMNLECISYYSAEKNLKLEYCFTKGDTSSLYNNTLGKARSLLLEAELVLPTPRKYRKRYF